MEFYVFEKESGLRSFVKDGLYTVNCPKAEEVYVFKAIRRLREICDECDELPKYEGVDNKNGVKLDKIADFKMANVSADYLVASGKQRVIEQHRIRGRNETYFIMAAASIVEKLLNCKEKSKDGYYYYCEVVEEPIPEEYFQGYEGVQLISITKVDKVATIHGPEYMYCYTFTKTNSTKPLYLQYRSLVFC